MSFAWEQFARIADELLPLWKKHYAEIALDQDACPLDPDWAQYYAQAELGMLHILTARSVNGTLAGYVVNIVGPHKHYHSTTFAHVEMFWLHPYFRKGWQPVKMFKENARGLRERGAVVSTIAFKLTFEGGRVGKLLHRLGYRASDVLMRMRL